MVSSCPVDLTVAASEKLLKNKSRGGQHAKKFKKAKRKAEAIERIRRGDPPPRHVPKKRVFVELPKPICAFYMEGKCRKGSDCSFRHDRSALIKRKEVCRCWEGDRCKFSHDALTEETGQLLRAFLNPPTEDPAQLPQEKNLASQQTGGGNTRVEDTLQTATASSPYNLRASTRKRTLSTDGEGTGGKISRQENPGKDQEDASQANNEGQRCAFLPGLYRDLSK
ncbi:Zinc finger CCCH domain-containing protein 6 [Desmophyllum pertusum]|uniref:Zinc finger CCCH domain-containing protein 6 n=1 Tax=Desmophyllum pertusum TaxID=174260 RepID=A0A9X0CCZ2_9CNID|nr:Zinc finger CCCH domain-containing protein 6 [Desmophyllum pertusum]